MLPRVNPLPARLAVRVLGLLVGDVGHSAKKPCVTQLGLASVPALREAQHGVTSSPRPAPPKHFLPTVPDFEFSFGDAVLVKELFRPSA